MSWLVSSIANSLKLDDDDESNDNLLPKPPNPNNGDNLPNPNPNSSSDQTSPPRGVKEDLSELSQTLTRQFWGVASFLAPPPQISDIDRKSDGVGIDGIRNDLSEIGGKFRTGISKISGNKTVSEITKIASNWLQFASENLSIEDYAQRGVIGVTEEVVAFAKDIALHPETWLDFPLPDEDGELDFDLSDAQQEHALAIERLAPELEALRIELCLSYMSEASFWKIYFVLVHPRLSRHDAEILSTPEIVRAREMLSQEFHTRNKPKPYKSGTRNASEENTELSHEEHLSVPVIHPSESGPVEISAVDPVSSAEADFEVDKHPVTSTEIPVVDKTVVEEALMKQTNIEKTLPSTSKSVELKDEEDADIWLEEDNTGGGTFKGTSFSAENDDDISFSDLEEDEEVSTSSKKLGNPKYKSIGDNPKNKGSSDWLDIDNIDDA